MFFGGEVVFLQAPHNSGVIAQDSPGRPRWLSPREKGHIPWPLSFPLPVEFFLFELGGRRGAGAQRQQARTVIWSICQNAQWFLQRNVVEELSTGWRICPSWEKALRLICGKELGGSDKASVCGHEAEGLRISQKAIRVLRNLTRPSSSTPACCRSISRRGLLSLCLKMSKDGQSITI